MRRSLPLLALLAASCGPTTRPDFVVHLVDGTGGNPFQSFDCPSAAVRVDVAQGANEVLTTNGSIAAGQPTGALSVEIPSYGLVTQIQVTATCTSGAVDTLVGSTPAFLPTGYGFVNVVLGPPLTDATSECVSLQTPVLTPATIGPQLVRLDANVIAVGGVSQSGMPSAIVQGFDTVSLTHLAQPGQFDALPTGFGSGRAVRLDATRILLVANGIIGVYDASPDATTTFDPLEGAHTGAGSESALVDLVDTGFAIVGGADGDDPVRGITWLTRSATGEVTVTTGTLAFARRQPAAVYVQGKLLVAGGQLDGEPLFELITAYDTADPATPFAPTTTEARFSPVLTTDLTHARALLVLGSADPHDATVQRDTTYELSECTASGPTPGCTVTTGPTFADPRSGVAVVEHTVGAAGGTAEQETLLLGGLAGGMPSPLVDRIRFDGAHFGITAAGMLRGSRARAGATEIGGGVVLVGGGADERGNPINTIELCFPPVLAPIRAQ